MKTSSCIDEVMFISEGGAQASRTLRTGHRKSRRGCQRCRTRHVKCDEVRPVCGNCHRLQFTCPFEQDEADSRAGEPPERTNRDVSEQFAVNPLVNESRERRLLELKLMHAYATKTSRNINTPADLVGTAIFTNNVPLLALESQALLNTIFAFTALHLAYLYPADRRDYVAVHHDYYSAALQDHAREVAELHESTYDAACMTSMFMRLIADVNRQERSLSPYTPPTEWFNLSRGAMQVFKVAYRWHDLNNSAASARMRDRMPFVFDTKAQFQESNQVPFQNLLDPIAGDDLRNETPAVQLAYVHIVRYIGGIWLNFDECERSEIMRRLSLMPFLADTMFADLLAAAQPRALAIIAHYFAILSKFSDFWWIGACGRREINALSTFLDQDWRELLSWPMQMIDT